MITAKISISAIDIPGKLMQVWFDILYGNDNLISFILYSYISILEMLRLDLQISHKRIKISMLSHA